MYSGERDNGEKGFSPIRMYKGFFKFLKLSEYHG